MTEGQIIEALEEASDLFIQNTMIRDAGRTIKWGIVKGLSSAMGWCQKLYTVSLGAVDFTNYSKLDSWISTLKPVFMGIMMLALLYLGITFIVGSEKRPKILQSLCLTGLCISGLAYILTVFSPLTADLAKTIAGNQTLTNNVILENLYDLQYIDQNWGLDKLDGGNLSKYTYSGLDMNIKLINFNEVINPQETEGLSASGEEILSKYILYTVDETGAVKKQAADIYTGMNVFHDSQGNGLLNSFYYRYEMDFLPIFLTSVAYIIVYLLLAYKVIRIIFEIAVYRVLALLYSADLNGTQKTMKILAGIRDSYIVLLFTAVEIKVFGYADEFLRDITNGQPVIYAFLMLFVAIAVIDGPNLIQQLTGIDAGLNSLLGKVIAAGQMSAMTTSFSARMLSGAVRATKGGVEKAARGVSNLQSGKNESLNNSRTGNQGGKESADIHGNTEKRGESAGIHSRTGNQDVKESADIHGNTEKRGENAGIHSKTGNPGENPKEGLNGNIGLENGGDNGSRDSGDKSPERLTDNIKDAGKKNADKGQPVNKPKSSVDDDFKAMDQDLSKRKTGNLTGSSGSGIDRQVNYSSTRSGSVSSGKAGKGNHIENDVLQSRDRRINDVTQGSLENSSPDKINRKSILSDDKNI